MSVLSYSIAYLSYFKDFEMLTGEKGQKYSLSIKNTLFA